MSPHRTTQLFPMVCLGGAVILWGTSFAATKTALSAFAPVTLIWLRMAIASVIVLALWRHIPKGRYQAGDWRWLLLMVLCEPCLYFLLEVYALKYTTSGQAGVIAALVPLIVALGAWLLLAERLTGRVLAGLAISIAGVIALSLSGSASEQAPNPLLGNLLQLGAMTCAAGYVLTLKHLTQRYPALYLTGLQSLAGAVFFLPGLLLAQPRPWIEIPAFAWLTVLYLGTAVTLGAFGLFNYGVSQIPASRASLFINLIPVVAVATGWAFLDEYLTAWPLAAMAAILLGVFIGESHARTRGPLVKPAE